MQQDPLIGRRLGEKFEVVSYLARGGMGVVYRGVQHPLGRDVAIKVLSIEEDDDGSFKERFFNEASICASLSHPNVVRVYDYGVTDDGICFLVMELLLGEPLHSMLKRERTLTPRLAIDVMRDICSAVQEAHSHGVVHRDLKPGNLFMVERKQRGLFVKVLDFGLAKRIVGDGFTTKTGLFLGSPTYISPEQIKGEAVSPATDVYNAGLILFRMLTGTAAFRAEQPSATLVAHCTAKPPRFIDVAPDLEVPEELEWVVRTCLQKRPSERFASMDELTRALEFCQMVMRGEHASAPLRLNGNGKVVLPADVRLQSQQDTGILKIKQSPDPEPPSSATRPTQAGKTLLLLGAGGSLLAFLLLATVTAAVLAAYFYNQGPPVVPEPVPIVAPIVEPEPVPQPEVNGNVEVQSEPSGAKVFMGTREIGITPMRLDIPPGATWTIHVTKEGYRTRKVFLKDIQPLVRIPLAADP